MRVKFICISIKKFQGSMFDEQGTWVPGILYDYHFEPVSSGSSENKKFYAATPSGGIHLESVKDNVFEVGKEYYVDFTPAW